MEEGLSMSCLEFLQAIDITAVIIERNFFTRHQAALLLWLVDLK